MNQPRSERPINIVTYSNIEAFVGIACLQASLQMNLGIIQYPLGAAGFTLMAINGIRFLAHFIKQEGDSSNIHQGLMGAGNAGLVASFLLSLPSNAKIAKDEVLSIIPGLNRTE